MPIIPLEEAPVGEESYVVFPDDAKFVVEVTGVTEKVLNFVNDDGSQAKRLAFDFRIADGPQKGRKLQQDIYFDFNRGVRCKLFWWVKELFGVDDLPASGPNRFVLNTDDLVGKQAWATLGIREWTNTTGGGKVNTVKLLNRLTASAPVMSGFIPPSSVPVPASAPSFPTGGFAPAAAFGSPDDEPF